MYWVYILKSVKTGKYCVGASDNIERRLREHNRGLSKYTKVDVPWELAYKEEYETLVEARGREKQIKSWKKRKAIERLIVTGPIV